MDSFTLTTQLVHNPKFNRKHTRSWKLHPHCSPLFILRCSAAPLFSSPTAIGLTAITGFSAESAADVPTYRLHRLSGEFRSLPEPIDRVKRLLFYAADLPPFPDADRIPSNRVTGCTAQVWLSARIDSLGRMRFAADSDSEITRGFCACLLSVVDGALPEDVLAMGADDLADLNVVGVAGRTHSRVNTWHNVLVSMQKRARAFMAEGEERQMVDPFPSLAIGSDGIRAKGGYTDAQASPSSMSWSIMVLVVDQTMNLKLEMKFLQCAKGEDAHESKSLRHLNCCRKKNYLHFTTSEIIQSGQKNC